MVVKKSAPQAGFQKKVLFGPTGPARAYRGGTASTPGASGGSRGRRLGHHRLWRVGWLAADWDCLRAGSGGPAVAGSSWALPTSGYRPRRADSGELPCYVSRERRCVCRAACAGMHPPTCLGRAPAQPACIGIWQYDTKNDDYRASCEKPPASVDQTSLRLEWPCPPARCRWPARSGRALGILAGGQGHW